MKESKMYTLRKTGRKHFGVHRGHNTAGNVRVFVANRVTEFKILTFGPMETNSEIKRQPVGNQRSGKEIQVMEKK
jgi:hypothetical protein